MGVSFRDLCEEKPLGVTFHGETRDLDRTIRWVTVTEMEDPTPWLTGGELVLTTRLWLKSAPAQELLIRRLHGAGVAGFGFATGPDQQQLPEPALAEARARGLPAIETPYASPFMAITRFVAERLFEQEHVRRRRLVDAHDQLAQTLLSGQGLQGLMRSVWTLTGAPAGLVDLQGRVLAGQPTDHEWPMPEIVAAASRAADATGALSARLIEINGDPVAFLCSRTSTAPEILPYAERLIGLELAKRQAVAEERRHLAGQVIQDILRRVISDEEAERRLASFEVNLPDPRAVVLATADCDPARLRSAPWALYLGQDNSRQILTAVVGRHVVALVPHAQDARAVGQQLLDHLSRISKAVCVGVGGSYSGADGLRWSHLEAQDAVARGPGVHERTRLDLTRLLLANPELPLRRLARDTLLPLITSDRHGDGQLLETLRTFFACNESITLTAARLFVHRNTVHHRLRSIEKLTTLSLSSMHDRMQLWLAVVALDRPGAVAEAVNPTL
jgi:purine catabolism regulator